RLCLRNGSSAVGCFGYCVGRGALRTPPPCQGVCPIERNETNTPTLILLNSCPVWQERLHPASRARAAAYHNGATPQREPGGSGKKRCLKPTDGNPWNRNVPAVAPCRFPATRVPTDCYPLVLRPCQFFFAARSAVRYPAHVWLSSRPPCRRAS